VAWRLQKWADFDEIWHTCSFGEYQEASFLFFEDFDFWGLGTGFLELSDFFIRLSLLVLQLGLRIIKEH